VIYSVPGSCRRQGINPAEYLQDVFERLPKAKTSQTKSLTPCRLGQRQTRSGHRFRLIYSLVDQFPCHNPKALHRAFTNFHGPASVHYRLLNQFLG
jgi:hypothetical protein